MASGRKGLRITLTVADGAGENNIGGLLESLRYAGIVMDLKVGDCKETPQGRWLHELNFFVECPKGLDYKAWADMNIRRMSTFGIKAEGEVRF
jgi:hypothetical protein